MNTLLTLTSTLVPCLLFVSACGAAPTATARPPATAAPPTAAPTASPATSTPAPPTPTLVPTRPPATATPVPAGSTLPKATPAAGKGYVEGRVVWNDKPAAGIQLNLCEDVEALAGCKGRSYKATTNAGGDYRFADVEPGEYALTLRVFDTNDWLYITDETIGARKYAVAAGEVLAIRTQSIFKTDLKLSAPASAANLTNASPALKWQPYESAAYYQVYLGAEHGDAVFVNERVEAAEIAVPKPLLNCAYNWKVEAFNANKFKIAESDRLRFKVAGQAADCEVILIAPSQGVKAVPATGLKLSWKPHPLAKSYKVVLYDPDRPDGVKVVDFERVPPTQTQFQVDATLAPGNYLWWVQAHDEADDMVADSQPVSFAVK